MYDEELLTAQKYPSLMQPRMLRLSLQLPSRRGAEVRWVMPPDGKGWVLGGGAQRFAKTAPNCCGIG